MTMNASKFLTESMIFIIMIVIGAAVALAFGVPPHQVGIVAIGLAFVTSGGVGIYMMWVTRKVTRSLHKRFNEQNVILEKLVSGQDVMILTQKEMASTQKDMASTQKEMVSTQKNMASTLKEVVEILGRMEKKPS